MKSIINIFSRLMLMLVFIMTIALLNSAVAQTVDEEDEDGFFNDGINSDRFNSDIDNSYSNDFPEYEYRGYTADDETDGKSPKVTNLDVEVERTTSGNVGVIAGGGSYTTLPNNSSPAVSNNSVIGSINPPAKKDGPGSFVPDNDGDPDVPVDGGILGLALSGLAWGAFKKRKK